MTVTGFGATFTWDDSIAVIPTAADSKRAQPGLASTGLATTSFPCQQQRQVAGDPASPTPPISHGTHAPPPVQERVQSSKGVTPQPHGGRV